MKYKWLNKKDNNKIIIFFNGWGMDEKIVEHLNPENYDVLMFYDYNSLETNFKFNQPDNYDDKYLIAWSMGVMIATQFDIKYTYKTAINGTLKPIDNNFGIPEKIYDLTIRGFSQTGLKKFITNMGLDPSFSEKINRDFEEQKSELSALKKYHSNSDFKYDRIILSDNDKIIPTKNQSAFWGIEPNTKSGHSPFHLYEKWSDLL